MKYLLILQFCGDSIEALDNITAIEDQLIESLGPESEVDGHDIGSGQTNLFIFTSDPKATFETAKQVLKRMGLISYVTAAYRESNGANYIVIFDYHFYSAMLILRQVKDYPGRMEV